MTRRIYDGHAWRTVPVTSCSIGLDHPITVYVPDWMMPASEISSFHRAYALRGAAYVVAVWNEDSRQWDGYAFKEQFGTVIQGHPPE